MIPPWFHHDSFRIPSKSNHNQHSQHMFCIFDRIMIRSSVDDFFQWRDQGGFHMSIIKKKHQFCCKIFHVGHIWKNMKNW